MNGQEAQSQGLSDRGRTTTKQSLFQRVERHIGRRLVSGFLVLVPLLITLLILFYGFAYVDTITRPLVKGTPLDFPGIGVALTLVVFYVIGVSFAGKRTKAWQDAVLTRIPVVRTIYGVARQATETLSSPQSHHFLRVVFVEWPRPGFRALGFVTGHLPTEEGPSLAVVYIPTVPNPTSGNLAWIEEDQLIEADLSVEEAMKVIFSGGIVLPNVSQGQSLPASTQSEEEPKS